MSPPPIADHTFFATCPRNTEGLLLQELHSLGAPRAVETRGGVSFDGTLPLAYRACLWSRVASRVLVRLASFPVSDPDDLYGGVYDLPWEDHLGVNGTLAVEVTSIVRQGPLARLNTHFAEQRVKDAVVDRFRARKGGRPNVDLARPSVRINVHLEPTGATVSLDLSGESLHRRGYRLEAGEAPLKEGLAAAILIRAGWPGIAAGGGALVDPMCGSGTLLIEGALIAADIAPGLLRDYFGFLGWLAFDPSPWEELLDEARTRRDQGLITLPPLFGFDLDGRAIERARANARRAGLPGRLHLERRALASLVAPMRQAGRHPDRALTLTASPPPPGLVVANPPYGKRLDGTPDLISIYETLGERLKEHFEGWEAAVFTGNPELTAHLGLRAHRVNVLFNGPLECKLLLFRIGRLGIQAKVASGSTQPAAGTPAKTGSDVAMFENRIRKNLRHLHRWAVREGVSCYRVYDADLPEYAAAIDLYEDWAHVQEYAPPDTVDPVRARRRLKEMISAIPQALELPRDHVVLKVRRPQRGADQYQRQGHEGRFLTVSESGLHFLVNLSDYLDTGLFLDHRLTRRLIRDLSKGRRFLNLFAYTGSATVFAAAGEATSTTTVDLSPTYLDWTRRHLELNGFTGSRHSLVRADCMEWLAQATGSYGLIFLDAPTFSNSKSMKATLDIQRDHPALIRAAAGLLASDGILIFSTNFRRFRLDTTLTHEYTISDITKQTIPPDFARDPRIHRCFRITPGASRSTVAPRGSRGDRPEAGDGF